MKIVLGDFKTWRVRKFISFLITMSVCTAMMYTYAILFESDNVLVYTSILLLGMVFMAIIDDSKLLKTENDTDCKLINNCIIIKNNKIDYKICSKDIRLVYYETIRRRGKIKSLDIIGYRLVVKCKNKKYTFDSVQKEHAIWQETDLIKLYKLFNSIQS